MRAKLLQSCPTLCDPMHCSPSGSSVHGICKNTGLGCHALLQGIKLVPLMSPALAGRFFTSITTWEAPGVKQGLVINS